MKASEVRKAIVNRANAIVGMNRDQLGLSGDFAWCAGCVSGVLYYVGITNMFDYSCTSMQGKMAISPEWSEPEDWPIPGDIIFFDWDNKIEERPLDHVCICVGFNNDTLQITYVNGNGDSSYYVTEEEINVNAKGKDGHNLVAYWMRYVGDDATPSKEIKKEVENPKTKVMCTVELEQLDKGCASPSVETMQNLLADVGYDIVVDGRFGKDTDAVLRQFQKDYKLTVDGVCGPKTWKALIEAI